MNEDRCILNVDSPSYPPELEEFLQCSCRACVRYLREVGVTERERDRWTIYHDERFHRYMDRAFQDEWRDWPFERLLVFVCSWRMAQDGHEPAAGSARR